MVECGIYSLRCATCRGVCLAQDLLLPLGYSIAAGARWQNTVSAELSLVSFYVADFHDGKICARVKTVEYVIAARRVYEEMRGA